MNEMKLPDAKRAKLRMYFRMLYPSAHVMDEASLLAELSTPLRQVRLHRPSLHRGCFLTHPWGSFHPPSGGVYA